MDRDLDLAGDAGRVLQLVDVLQLGQVARDELADVGDHLCTGPEAPAEHRYDLADDQHPPRRRDRHAPARAGPCRARAPQPPPSRRRPGRNALALPTRAPSRDRAAAPPLRRAPYRSPVALAARAPPGPRSAPARRRLRSRRRAADRSRGPSGSARATARGTRPRSRAPRRRSPAPPSPPPRPRRRAASGRSHGPR